jgi:arylsulfatase A-like enzyme
MNGILCAQENYWYHRTGYQNARCAVAGERSPLVDFSDNVGPDLHPADTAATNGSYSTDLFAARAAEWITGAAASGGLPFAMYFAPMSVHLGAAQLLQAPRRAIDEHYSGQASDTSKVMGAMLTNLDDAVGVIVQALTSAGVYDDSLIVFVSDNGGLLWAGSGNAPFRGGKNSLFEGGVRVVGFVSGGLVPITRRGSKWPGMMHSADWYRTLLAAARVSVPPTAPGSRPLDGFDMWPRLLSGGSSPRTEVVHAVSNAYFNDGSTAIRFGQWKLIRGRAGDARVVAWLAPGRDAVPLGASGAFVEPHTDHVYAPVNSTVVKHVCMPWCLYNLEADPSESTSLTGPRAEARAAMLLQRLASVGATGHPPAYLFGGNSSVAPPAFSSAMLAICKRALADPSLTIQPVPTLLAPN